MKILTVIIVAVLLIGATFGIFWSGANDFGQRQGVEFFPYNDEITLDDSRVIRSSGVVIRINHYESAPDDQTMANLMVSAKRMYPEECSGENYEVAVRRPGPDGSEEKYSFEFSIYDTGQYSTTMTGNGVPESRIEYGKWVDDQYVVIESYGAEWSEISKIAQGQAIFRIDSGSE